mgnify:FL=1
MASVNMFLEIAEASSFNTVPSLGQIESSREDLERFGLSLDFESVDQLYLETRQEALANRGLANWVEI